MLIIEIGLIIFDLKIIWNFFFFSEIDLNKIKRFLNSLIYKHKHMNIETLPITKKN